MSVSDPFFADHALSARLEATEAAQLAAIVEVVTARLPARRAAALAIAGGCAAFLGSAISVSRAAGLGMSGPVEAADIEALEDFYRTRATAARILVSPFAHPSLLERLGERGFRLGDLDTVLVRRLSRDESFFASIGDARVRRARSEEAFDWVHTSMLGFFGSAERIDRDRAEMFEAAFHAPGVGYFFASINGAVAGTAGIYFHENTAHFFAASTLAGYQRRGVQSALITARLAAARDNGSDLVFTATAAGSLSQRNFERHGFRPVYSQALLTKHFCY